MLLDITQRYCEPHRAYHVLTHPAKMIEDGVKMFNLTNEQIIAIWYHDAIYNAGSSTNEHDSAALCYDHFRKTDLVSSESFDIIEQIILDTKDHIPNSYFSKAVIDLDLLGLGSRWTEYWNNAKLVRKEYSKYNEDEWKEGRKKFLEKMLGRERIYYTDMAEFLERPARINIEQEIRLLTNGNPSYK